MEGLMRSYHSDTSLVPDINRTVSDRAAGNRPLLIVAQSDPSLAQARKPHPLQDDAGLGEPHLFAELLLGAETLENIVAEGVHGATAGAMRRFRGFGSMGSLAGDGKAPGREMSDKVLRLVYGTMKYLPYIDTILVKTQFLVYNNQKSPLCLKPGAIKFLNHLGLVKIILYDLMRYHFDLQKFPGINYGVHSIDLPTPNPKTQPLQSQEHIHAELVRDLEDAIRRHNVKLAAAFARIRIERRATGDTTQEQMENILPEDVRAKEQVAVDMPKTVRINFLKTTKDAAAEELREAGYRVKTIPPTSLQVQQRITNGVKVEIIEVDDTFVDYFVIPADFFSDVKGSDIVMDGRLVFQDRASAYGMKHIASVIAEGEHIIDARVGCAVMRNKGKVFAFEDRPSRLESLRQRLMVQNVKNVDVMDSDFLTCDAQDDQFAMVSTVIVEPPSSGGAIVDKLGYLLQEEEFPNEHYSQKDIAALKRQQLNMVKHALTFPSVRNVLYITRATNREENEHVIEEILAEYNGEWELTCVLPDIVVERTHEWEIEECLKIKPSQQGNGVFIASLLRVPPPEPTPSPDADPSVIESQDLTVSGALDGATPRDSTNSKRGRKSRKNRPGSGNGIVGRAGGGGKGPRRPKSSHGGKKSNAGKLARHDSKADAEDGGEEDEGDDGDEDVAENSAGRRGGRVRRAKGPGGNGDGKKDSSDSLEFSYDFGVFGVSLKRFYAPKALALQQMGTSATTGPANDPMRWRYPVPNPRPWK
ncbi:putative 28S rRNA (cytosine-C(5))-methyltransferase [Irineochytrium annulatum]|nr:putative 28S rRNA (cytosine-C(5))-methyltransferase [Irineochytrium annulatum]